MGLMACLRMPPLARSRNWRCFDNGVGVRKAMNVIYELTQERKDVG